MSKKILALFILSFAGILFSGYLSATKLFTDTCAFGEACPYFMDMPACYYGFVMFLILFTTSILLVSRKIKESTGLIIMIIVSALGILFAGYFTLKEIPLLFSEGLRAYMLGLPTCALGFIFYILICSIAVSKKLSTV